MASADQHHVALTVKTIIQQASQCVNAIKVSIRCDKLSLSVKLGWAGLATLLQAVTAAFCPSAPPVLACYQPHVATLFLLCRLRVSHAPSTKHLHTAALLERPSERATECTIGGNMTLEKLNGIKPSLNVLFRPLHA